MKQQDIDLLEKIVKRLDLLDYGSDLIIKLEKLIETEKQPKFETLSKGTDLKLVSISEDGEQIEVDAELLEDITMKDWEDKLIKANTYE